MLNKEMSLSAADVIRLLGLKPHPEGGYFRETFRDARAFEDGRAASTAIYFCSRAASVRIGIASTRPRSGIGMPVRRSNSTERRRPVWASESSSAAIWPRASARKPSCRR